MAACVVSLPHPWVGLQFLIVAFPGHTHFLLEEFINTSWEQISQYNESISHYEIVGNSNYQCWNSSFRNTPT